MLSHRGLVTERGGGEDQTLSYVQLVAPQLGHREVGRGGGQFVVCPAEVTETEMDRADGRVGAGGVPVVADRVQPFAGLFELVQSIVGPARRVEEAAVVEAAERDPTFQSDGEVGVDRYNS